MATDIFKFKRFDVDQSGCAMKVNTDGVLLGALTEANDPQNILDIGTGTGVISLMLAQRFAKAQINAIEIDEQAAETAARNFEGSAFADRLNAVHGDFATTTPSVNYDLIVSNPPFFLDSLTSANEKKNLARHTDELFFDRLIKFAAEYLTDNGSFQLVVPLATAALIKSMLGTYQLYIQQVIFIRSFAESEPHREIITFGKGQMSVVEKSFVIYDTPKVYSNEYKEALQIFLTIF